MLTEGWLGAVAWPAGPLRVTSRPVGLREYSYLHCGCLNSLSGMYLPIGDQPFEDSTRNQIGLTTDRVSLLNQKMPKTTQKPWPSKVDLACFHPFWLSSSYRLPWTNTQSNTFESLSSHSLTLHVALVLSILPRNPHHLPGHNRWDINEHVGGVIIYSLFPVLGLITPLASHKQTKKPVTSNARALRTSISN